ncbi:MAG: rhomboid family intramembrane serine protease [Campylobacterota bacterium]|nr:rhomboid family intramembrane serine protease [Campylobacterota bacterium]
MQEFLRYRVTYSLSALIAFFYLYSIFYSAQVIDIPSRDLVEIGAVYPPFVVLKGEWGRILFSLFLHGGLIHMLFNIFALIIVGRVVEEYFALFDYLLLYFLSGIISVLASIYFHPLNVLIGASGAVFGIFGALVGFFIANRHVMMQHFREMMKNVGVILAINLGIGLVFPNIDMVAHIAGLLFGVVAGFIYAYDRRIFWGYSVVSIIAMVIFGDYLPNIYAQYLIR